MRFKAQYIAADSELPDYWRTVDADNQTEARKLAARYTKKGYRMVWMEQDIDHE